MAVTSVRMPDELMQQLDKMAEKLRRSKGWIINDVVKEYIEHAEKEAKMLEETFEGLEDLKAGRVVEGQAVMEWIESWGAPDEKEPPKC